MSDELDTLVRDRAEEIAALPPDDPLRRLLARSPHALPDEVQAGLDVEAEVLQRVLAHVEVPAIERALLAIPRTRVRTRVVAISAIAAALVLAFVLGQRTAPPPVAAPIVAEVAPVPAPTVPAPTRDGPRVIAVKWWHESCPACQEMDPRYADVMASFDESEVLFVTLDMSTALSRRQSALLASALGIRDVYDEMFGDSGFVMLFEAGSKRRLGRLTAAQDGEAMKSSIRDALARARS